MASSKSTATVLQHVKKADLPTRWQKQLSADDSEYQTFRIIIEPEEADENMPPEEMIREEFVEEIKRRDEAYKKGGYVECNTKEERDKFFESVWND